MIPVSLLIDSVATGAGTHVAVGDFRLMNGAIPILLYGGSAGFVATVGIQGTIALPDDANSGNCKWITIEGGEFTEETASALFAPFTHLRGYVSAYTSGTINLKIGL
jgi:hypothetical protein